MSDKIDTKIEDALTDLFGVLAPFLPRDPDTIHPWVHPLRAQQEAALVPDNSPPGRVFRISFDDGMPEEAGSVVDHVIGLALQRSGIPEGIESRHVVEKGKQKLVFSVPTRQSEIFVDALRAITQSIQKADKSEMNNRLAEARQCEADANRLIRNSHATALLHVPEKGKPHFVLHIADVPDSVLTKIGQIAETRPDLGELNPRLSGADTVRTIKVPVTDPTIVQTLHDAGVGVEVKVRAPATRDPAKGGKHVSRVHPSGSPPITPGFSDIGWGAVHKPEPWETQSNPGSERGGR